jgi:hypothetical protein
MRAYLTLHLVPRREDGARAVPVARVGHYEVRLVEAAPDGEELSLELHDHIRRVVVDSVQCDDLEVAEVFSEEMILWAHELQSNKRPPRLVRSGGRGRPCGAQGRPGAPQRFVAGRRRPE